MARKWKYGFCDCKSGLIGSNGCCGGKAPAVFEAIRNGKKVKLCTHCDLSSDETRLLVTKKDKKILNDLSERDTLGYFCVLNKLGGSK